MNIVAWIILGLAAGALAKLVMPGDQRGGCILTTVLGIAGAMLGGFIGTQLGYGGVSGFSWESLGWAFLGSFLLLLVFGLLFGRKRR
ncbi:MAG: GlsB/YeaQ/YmgE family stress response membrane protein [Gemmatimonadota bacterium]